MTNQGTNQENAQQTIGIFYDENEAKSARNFLEAAGFSQEQLSIRLEAPTANQPVHETQAARSAAGGAIVGALFGGVVGFLIAVVTKGLPATSVSLQLNPLALALAGAAIGAFSFTLMGIASGLNVPETVSGDSDEPAYKYRVLLNGTNADLLRGAEVLRQRGIQVWNSMIIWWTNADPA